MITNTQPYRRAMLGYQHEHGLAPEKGFDANRRGPLGRPARNLLRRVQANMEATGNYPNVMPTGVLDKPSREALVPPRTLGDVAVHYALREVGVHESPWGSNAGPRIHTYQSVTGAYNAAWCASFVSWCYRQAGYRGTVTAGAWAWENLAPRVVLELARPGDPVIFNIGTGHIGLYLSHNSMDVKTVDGNTSDQVAVRDRPLADIRTIIRPHN